MFQGSGELIAFLEEGCPTFHVVVLSWEVRLSRTELIGVSRPAVNGGAQTLPRARKSPELRAEGSLLHQVCSLFIHEVIALSCRVLPDGVGDRKDGGAGWSLCNFI